MSYPIIVVVVACICVDELAVPRDNNPGATASAAESTVPASSLICGPRCVQRVLRSYGRSEDLIELIKECQWPNIERGASIESLVASLERRGIHARAYSVPKYASIQCDYPAILFLTVEGAAHRGHFVVLESSADGIPSIWDGSNPNEVQSKSTLEFTGRVACVIVTSPHAITVPPKMVWRGDSIGIFACVSLVIGIVLLATLLASVIPLREVCREPNNERASI